METVRLDREISQTTAQSGVIVLSERVPSVRSVAVGIWVRSASAHEPRPKMGVSHLLEHMVFKGTERRTAQQIALALESRGGSLDAYTSRDTTAFQARVLDTDLPQALDVLTDLVRNPALRPSDLELERNVVLEEINTVEDTPDDQVFDLSYKTLWPEHPYGYSILGTRDTVGAMSTSDLKQLHERAYFPANCVIAAAGNMTHERLLELLGEQGWFDDRERGKGKRETPAAAPIPPALRGAEARHSKDTAQTHIVFVRRPAQVRAPRARQRVRGRDVEPPVPADPGRAGAGLRDLRVHELLSAGRSHRGVRRHAAQDRGPSRGGDPRGVRQARPHGTHRRGARRGEAADARAADVVPGESVRADVSFGRFSDSRRAVPELG